MVSVVIPTRDRPAYLEAALASLAPQVAEAGGEIVVVDDGAGHARDVARRHDARYVARPDHPGLNAARNAGAAVAEGELVVFVDDDVLVAPGWLATLLGAAAAHPGWHVVGGPIEPRLEGSRARGCGRDGPPVTSLDLGPVDAEAEFVWGANMLVTRAALELAGPFDPGWQGPGDEEGWERRLRGRGGRIGYAAQARVHHRRSGPDARPLALARAAWERGRAARRWDIAKGMAPRKRAEALTAARSLGHAVRRRCPWGAYAAVHASGRLREAIGG